MTDRKTASTITDTDLDRLYAERDQVHALYEHWVKAGPPPLGASLARWWDARLVELHIAIHPPNDHTPER